MPKPPKNNIKKKTFKAFLKRFLTSKWIKSSLIVFVILLAIAFSLANSFQRKHTNDPLVFGVSFSTKFAKELGLDWKQAYLAIAKDLGIKKLRIMSYWDEYQISEDKYDFTDLDWQFEQAEKNDIKLSLAIGLRQPRWPECHYPDWTKSLEEEALNQALLVYLEKVVVRYRNHPALESYQLENEVANGWFGECPSFNRDLLKTEFNLVKRLDPNHPVIINVSNQSDLVPIREPIADKLGFSVYNHADGALFGRHWTWRFWYVPASWHSLRAALIERLHNRPVFIHELQTEPWGARSIAELTRQEQDELMSPEKLRQHIEYGQKTGIPEMYLWGAEWWYWRTQKYQDYSYWDTVREIFKGHTSPEPVEGWY
jgi:hypothetical protein